MKIRILGGGWYGCHLAVSLIRDGHDVVLFEKSNKLFSGASGANPARLHLGFHYPRSSVTRQFSQTHYGKFMDVYSEFTRAVPVNIYATACDGSLVDFGTYSQIMSSEVPCLIVEDPADYGLRNVEGAMLTGERHIIIRKVREFFEEQLRDSVSYNCEGDVDDAYDFSIDCTFCSNTSDNVHRYEPCVTAIVRGRCDKAVTIMDGPFPSIYPWDEDNGLLSMTSAKYTPLARCSSYEEARSILDKCTADEAGARVVEMFKQLGYYYPEVWECSLVDAKLSIRAMPNSTSDARFVDIVKTSDNSISVRAGKIDAVVYAEKLVKEVICKL